MKPETESIERFLECTDVIDWKSPEILEAVASIVPPRSSDAPQRSHAI